MPKVPVQKGPVNCKEVTMKMQTYAQRVAETRAENALRRSGQTLTSMGPKSSKK